MKSIQISCLSVLLVLSSGMVGANDLIAIYQQAILEDPQLAYAREALGVVKEKQSQASSALFLPEANLNANINQDRQNVQLGGVGATGESGRSTFMYGGYTLTLTQPILHYDRIVAWQQSDIKIAQAEAEYAAAEINLLLRVTERYFDALSAMDNVKFAQAQVNTLARGLKEVQQRQLVGYLAMTDVQEAQAGYDRALADAVEAEHILNDAKEALQEVTGARIESLAGLSEKIPLVPPDPTDEELWVKQAISQNLSLLVSDLAVKIAEADIDIEKAGHLPTLNAVGSQSFLTSGGRFGSANIEDTVIGMALNVPLYQGGQVNSKIRAAEHRHREMMANLKQSQRTVHRVTSKAYLGVITGVSRIKALKQAVISSQTGLKATQAGFYAGRRTTLDVITAEAALLRAQKDYARSRYDYVLNTLRLKQSVGVLSPEDIQKVNSWLTVNQQ